MNASCTSINSLRRRRAERGTAVVEFVLCLPILLLLIIMTVEACNMIYLKHSLAVAAYEGARTSTIKGATTRDVERAAEEVLDQRKIHACDVQISPDRIRDAAMGQYITVTATTHSKPNAVFKGLFDTTLRESVSMMKEY